jgi:hypothetical protein
MGANQRARNACIWAEMRVYSRDGQLALLLNLVDAQWTSPFRRPDRSRERSSVEDRPGLACTTASTKAACHDGRKHPGCRVGASRAKSGERPSAGRWTAVCWSVWPGRLGGAACHGRSTLPLWLRCGYGPTATPDGKPWSPAIVCGLLPSRLASTIVPRPSPWLAQYRWVESGGDDRLRVAAVEVGLDDRAVEEVAPVQVG